MQREDQNVLLLWLNAVGVAEPVRDLADLRDCVVLCKAARLIEPARLAEQPSDGRDSEQERRSFVCSFLRDHADQSDLPESADLAALLSNADSESLAEVLRLLLLAAVRETSSARQLFVDAALSLPASQQSRIYACLHAQPQQTPPEERAASSNGNQDVDGSRQSSGYAPLQRQCTLSSPGDGLTAGRLELLSPVVGSGARAPLDDIDSVDNDDGQKDANMVSQHVAAPGRGRFAHGAADRRTGAAGSPLAASSPFERYLRSPALVGYRTPAFAVGAAAAAEQQDRRRHLPATTSSPELPPPPPTAPNHRRQHVAELQRCREELEQEQALREEAQAEMRAIVERLATAEARCRQLEQDYARETAELMEERSRSRQLIAERDQELVKLRRADSRRCGSEEGCETAVALRKEVAALEAELSELRRKDADVEALTRQRDQLIALCDRQLEHVRSVSDEAARLRTDVASAVGERDVVREQLRLLRDECEELRVTAAAADRCGRRLGRTASAVADDEDVPASTAEPSVAMEMQLHELNCALSEARQNLQERAAAAEKLADELSALSVQRDDLEADRYHLVIERDELAAERARLAVERAALAERCDVLTRNACQTAAEVERLDAACATLRSERDRLAAERDDLVSECRRRSVEYADACRRLDDLADEQRLGRAERDRLVAERDFVDDSRRQLRDECERLRRDAEAMASERAAAEAEALRLLRDAQQELQFERERYASAEAASERQCLADADKLECLILALADSERQLEDTRRQTSERLEQLQSERGELAGELDCRRAEIERAMCERAALSERLAESNADRDRLTINVDRLCDQLAAVDAEHRQELARAEAEMSALKERLMVRIAELEAERTSAAARAAEEEEDRRQHQQQVRSDEERRTQSLEADLAGLRVERDRLIEERNFVDADRQRLATEHDRLVVERDLLERLVSGASADRNRAIAEAEAKAAEAREAFGNERAALSAEMDELRRALAESQSARAAVELTVQQLKESLDVVGAAKDESKVDGDELLARCNQLKASKAAAESESGSLQLTVRELRSSLHDKEKTIQNLADATEGYKKMIESYRVYYKQKKELVEQLSAELEVARAAAAAGMPAPTEARAAAAEMPAPTEARATAVRQQQPPHSSVERLPAPPSHHSYKPTALAAPRPAAADVASGTLPSVAGARAPECSAPQRPPSAVSVVASGTSRSSSSAAACSPTPQGVRTTRAATRSQGTSNSSHLLSNETLPSLESSDLESRPVSRLAPRAPRPISSAGSPNRRATLAVGDASFMSFGSSSTLAAAAASSDESRLEELRRRNTLCLPHMRSVYALELQDHSAAAATLEPPVDDPPANRRLQQSSAAAGADTTNNAARARDVRTTATARSSSQQPQHDLKRRQPPATHEEAALLLDLASSPSPTKIPKSSAQCTAAAAPARHTLRTSASAAAGGAVELTVSTRRGGASRCRRETFAVGQQHDNAENDANNAHGQAPQKTHDAFVIPLTPKQTRPKRQPLSSNQR